MALTKKHIGTMINSTVSDFDAKRKQHMENESEIQARALLAQKPVPPPTPAPVIDRAVAERALPPAPVPAQQARVEAAALLKAKKEEQVAAPPERAAKLEEEVKQADVAYEVREGGEEGAENVGG